MVHTCAAVGCHNRKNPGTSESFYRFPREEPRRGKWIAAVRRVDWQPTDSSRLCSAHFISGKKSEDPVSPDYVPSIFDYVPSHVKRKRHCDLDTYEHRQKLKTRTKPSDPDKTERRCRGGAGEILTGRSAESTPKPSDPDKTERRCRGGADEILTGNSAESGAGENLTQNPVDYEAECRALRVENHNLRQTITALSLTEEIFMVDSEKVRFHTGLPNYNVFNSVLTLLSPQMTEPTRCKLSHFQQLLLTLMKLRLNLFHQDLAYRFGVHISTISRTVHHIVDLLFTILVPTAIIWPDREELRKTLPMAFRQKYQKCVAIIDCFEVALERSSDQEAQSQTYSSYKSRNTLKYLIGIAPQGVITFISKGWGGRTSDKVITENSGFLQKLLPGDQVLADRGFDIQECLAMHGATLAIPAFTRGKQQLSKKDCDSTRELASLRIHVERVIGTLRQKYTMLNGPVEIPYTNVDPTCNLTTFDKIVQVSCALCNLCESVVPIE
uniref:THAP-type domain-containing protein n=1 Tax=Branchiostoma floridae TaxID=7739 RepID=C3ZM17_BRAFL|eukprot:XP_002590417.1 hypothetical protein BRAFLDRAFT_201218 [Branchiostoma floridae]